MTPEAIARAGDGGIAVEVVENRAGAYRAKRVSVLDRLHVRSPFEAALITAARRLQDDWQMAEARAKVQDFERVPGGGGARPPEPTIEQVEAGRRYAAARRWVEGVCGWAWPVIEAVVIDGRELQEAAARLAEDPRGMRGVLEKALDLLARHYAGR